MKPSVRKAKPLMLLLLNQPMECNRGILSAYKKAKILSTTPPFSSFFLLFMLFLKCVLLLQGEGNTMESYNKQHSSPEVLFRPSPGSSLLNQLMNPFFMKKIDNGKWLLFYLISFKGRK